MQTEDRQVFLGKYRQSNGKSDPPSGPEGDSLTYHACEIDSEKEVIIDLVPSAALDEEVRARLEIEAIAAQKLIHVNVAPLYDFGLENGRYVYVSERFEGTLAEKWIQENGPLPLPVVLRISLQIINAIEAAAALHLVHRAINPANVMLMSGQTPEGEWPLVKLLHFVGAPAKVSESDGSVAAFDPALHYASPEQIEAGTVDIGSEVYSLGCTMWFLLTGSAPLVAHNGELSASAEARPNISRKLKRLLAQMLSTNPKARAKSLGDLRFQLELCLGESERRTALYRKWGIPGRYRDSADSLPREPMRWGTMVLVGLLLIGATLAAVMVPELLRQHGYLRSEKHVGVMIGVPDAHPTTTPANSIVEASAQSSQASPAIAQVSPQEPATTPNANNGPASVDLAAVAKIDDRNQPELPVTPVPFENTVAASDSNASQSPALVANNEMVPDGTPVTSSATAEEVHPMLSPSRDTLAGGPTQSRSAEGHEVRRGELVESAVPKGVVPPSEGPPDSATESESSAAQAKVTSRQRESSARESERQKIPGTKRQREKEPDMAVRSRARSERSARFERNRQSNAASRRGWVRAHVVAVTPDGNWMVELPSGKIMIVPPPEEFR